MTDWEPDIQAIEQRDRENPPPVGAIAFAGSSSITNWQSLADDFPSHQVINRGFGGSQIADSTHYAARIILPYKPRLIVLYAGDNDLADGKTVAQVEADFRIFVETIQAALPQTNIAFISIKPSPWRRHLMSEAQQANARIEAICKSSSQLDFINVFPAMLDAAGEPRAELFVEDELHMNRSGYELWISIIAPHLRY